MNNNRQLDKALTKLEHLTVYAWLGSIALLLIVAIIRAFMPSSLHDFIESAQLMVSDFMIATMVAFGCLYFIRVFVTSEHPRLSR